MPLISFIIPVYNTENYLAKCLDSILSQTNNSFEIIIINDGSEDNSASIISKYQEKYGFTVIDKQNEGLSSARNDGVKVAKGKYIAFIDSDDYIASNFVSKVETIDKKENVDMIRIGYSNVYNDRVVDVIYNFDEKTYTSSEYFNIAVANKSPFEMACVYVYNREYWTGNNFLYQNGRYHEDFGLTPIVILKANKIAVIKEILYFYLQRENSIMTTSDLSKQHKKADDLLYYYDYLLEESRNISLDNSTKAVFLSYIANALILKAKTLDEEYFKIYLKELQKRKVFDSILSDTLKRKIKKFLLKIYPKFFIRVR